jgi:hypothetical protein
MNAARRDVRPEKKAGGKNGGIVTRTPGERAKNTAARTNGDAPILLFRVQKTFSKEVL